MRRAQVAESSSPFVVLGRHRDFRLFWLGNLVSSIGVWMQHLAQAWLLLELTDSPLVLGVGGFLSFGPTLVLSLVGGTLADRLDRRRLLIVTQAVMMLLALFLGALVLVDRLTATLLLAVMLLGGIATALNSPAYQASIPDLVPPQDLTRAIALNSIQFNTARVLGHSSAGLLVATLGAAGCFFINGSTYVVMLAVLLRIHFRSRHLAGDRSSFPRRLAEGLAYVQTHGPTRHLLCLLAVVSGLGLPYFFLLPVFARDVLHQDPGRLGYLMGSVSLGALAGGFVSAYVARTAGRERTVLTGTAAFWLALLAFSASRHYVLSLGLLALLGAALALTVVAANSLLQAMTPPPMRGRVMSAYGMALNGMAPIGSLVAGSLAQAVTAPIAIAAMAVLGLGFTILLTSRAYGRLESVPQFS